MRHDFYSLGTAASILTDGCSAHTQAVAYLIGETASEKIISDYS